MSARFLYLLLCFLGALHAGAAGYLTATPLVDINRQSALHSAGTSQPHANPQSTAMTRQTFNTAALRKHAALFTLAAGVTAGGIAGIGTLYKDHFATPAAQTQTAQPVATQNTAPVAAPQTNAAAKTYPHPVAGDVVYKDTQSGMLHIRAHVWVAQFNTVSICPPKVTANCQYTADVRAADGSALGAAPRAGQKITLHGLTPTQNAQPVMPEASAPTLRPRSHVVAGPIPARVIKTGDGDTVQTEVHIWPDTRVLIDIRIGDIDTPEKGGRAKCSEEAARAQEATAEMRRLLEGKNVTLHNVKYEKYGGRLLADIKTSDGTDAAQHMIEKRLAVQYGGGTKSSWCTLARHP